MSDDPAKARYFVIALARLSGAAMVMIGLLMTRGTWGAPPLAGYLVLALGLADFVFVPRMLARRWRTRE
jgi:hypothetical protein